MTSEEEIEFQKLYKNTWAGQRDEAGKRLKELNKEILKSFKGGEKMIKRFTRAIHRYCWVRRIEIARETIRHAFEVDDDFKHGYVANIAMLFHDRYGRGNYITNREKRNRAAEEILDLIFKEN